MPEIYDLRLPIPRGDGQHNKAPNSLHSKMESISIEIKKRSGLANTKGDIIGRERPFIRSESK